jgi:hypothetical protein
VISVVCWKWRVPGRAEFRPEYVNTVAAMFRRHYAGPSRFICVTDEPKGLDSSIEAVPTPEVAAKLGDLPAPRGVRFPSSYRRLWNFSADARAILGERIFAIDIDILFTADLAPLLDTPGDFVSWWDPRFNNGAGWKGAVKKVPGGIYLHRTGTMSHVWDTFDRQKSPAIAEKAGTRGSDQGWMSYMIYPAPKAWTVKDGVYSIKWLSGRTLPRGVRVVSTPGELKPWDAALQRKHPWIREHWKL